MSWDIRDEGEIWGKIQKEILRILNKKYLIGKTRQKKNPDSLKLMNTVKMLTIFFWTNKRERGKPKANQIQENLG